MNISFSVLRPNYDILLNPELKGKKMTGLKDKARELIEEFKAKSPQLEMKLKNMPVPLTADMVDEYMKPVLEAALTGDFSAIKTV